MITYPASIPNLVENSTPLRDNWIAGLRTRWGAVHRRCAHPECSRQFSPLLAALPSRTGILLEGLWYCGSRCFARALPHLLKHPKLARRTRRLPDHRIPLGLLMMSRGELTYEQLKTALHAQRQAAQGLLGDWLCELGYSNERQITVALGVQSSCPVLSRTPVASRQWSGWLPLELQMHFKAIPVHYNAPSRLLSLAFSERVDHTLLYTAGRMLRCQTHACLMPRSEFNAGLEESKAVTRDNEAAFDCEGGVQELSQITISYADRLAAREVDVAHCDAYVWIRLRSRRGSFDLLLRDQTDG